MKVRVHPAAEAELRAAAVWYEGRGFGLGEELLAAVGAALDSIRSGPDSCPPVEPQSKPMLRRMRVSRFPYFLVFEQADGEIRVLAVAHAHRRPGYRRNRLRDFGSS